VRGDVVVLLVTDRTERLAIGSVLDSDRGPLEVISAKPHHDRWIVRFAQIGDREAAESARGLVLRADIGDVDGGEMWVHDVIGATVVTADGIAHEAGCVTIDPPEGLLDL
jgi:16S rRNA processing protein RimM